MTPFLLIYALFGVAVVTGLVSAAVEERTPPPWFVFYMAVGVFLFWPVVIVQYFLERKQP